MDNRKSKNQVGKPSDFQLGADNDAQFGNELDFSAIDHVLRAPEIQSINSIGVLNSNETNSNETEEVIETGSINPESFNDAFTSNVQNIMKSERQTPNTNCNKEYDIVRFRSKPQEFIKELSTSIATNSINPIFSAIFVSKISVIARFCCGIEINKVKKDRAIFYFYNLDNRYEFESFIYKLEGRIKSHFLGNITLEKYRVIVAAIVENLVSQDVNKLVAFVKELTSENLKPAELVLLKKNFATSVEDKKENIELGRLFFENLFNIRTGQISPPALNTGSSSLNNPLVEQPVNNVMHDPAKLFEMMRSLYGFQYNQMSNKNKNSSSKEENPIEPQRKKPRSE